ncbi:hypothetical protein GCM10009839_46870 [Catenulispora yoronensis]|uniref:MbtH-like domain-containing protein n=1 Tax=Catenulispora yoronensis TaxID=450799 RepID=A0ABP5G5F7_9ACTN
MTTTNTTIEPARSDREPNPFEDDSARYLVLVNDLGQHSTWPARLAVPAGWDTAFGPAGRGDCLEYVETHWTQLMPGRG